MALVSTGQATKQINITGGAVNVIMYTVPSGRKFEGYFTTSTSTTSYIRINGYDFYIAATLFAGTTYGFVVQPTPIKLVAGTVISAGTANLTGIFGVESDA